MKKSLIAMALMFGAVVFVASSCGGDDPDTPEMCTVKVVDGTNKVDSEDYPNPVEKSKAPTSLGTKDAAKYKNGSYVCE